MRRLGIDTVARFGTRKLAFLRRFRAFAHGTPSHDQLANIFATLDAEHFQRCFVAWVAALTDAPAEVIAIDGKTARRPVPSALRGREQRRQGGQKALLRLGDVLVTTGTPPGGIVTAVPDKQIARLGEDAFVNDDARQEAMNAVRALIARVDVHPGERRGQTQVNAFGLIEKLISPAQDYLGGASSAVRRTATMVAAGRYRRGSKGRVTISVAC